MICRYPTPCKGLSAFILGDWYPAAEFTGLYRYVVRNTRTGDSALYGLVFARKGERPVWLDVCPICRVEFGPWIRSGKVANGTENLP